VGNAVDGLRQKLGKLIALSNQRAAVKLFLMAEFDGLSDSGVYDGEK